MPVLERFSITVERDLLERFDELRRRTGQTNRSEAVRDLLRGRLGDVAWAADAVDDCVATLTLVYERARREITDQATLAAHVHHTKVVATLHLHLDEDACLEVTALRGRPPELQAYADHLLGLQGVRYGRLVMTPTPT